RPVHGVDLAAPSGGPRRRARAGRVRLLLLPRNGLATGGREERPRRVLLRRGGRPGPGRGAGGVAVGRFPALARRRAWDRGECLLRRRSGGVPQGRRPAAPERAVRAGAGPPGTVPVAFVLPPPVP